MKYCPITYEPIADDARYSAKGLKKLSPQLKQLKPLAFTQAGLMEQALQRKAKMSVQGMQTKLSARLYVKAGEFQLVDIKGQYILKPQSAHYPALPENEALTMSLAQLLGLEVPVHGLLYGEDNTLTYFVKRFDRMGHNKKVAVEDFAQLSLSSRQNKYQSSMEQVAKMVEHFCSVPQLELAKLFKLVLFNFLTGNEDAHLKNFSLITENNLVKLSPVYDLLNTTLAGFDREQMALPLNKRKNNLRHKDFFEYYANERLKLNDKIIQSISVLFQNKLPECIDLIECSFLPKALKVKYVDLLKQRAGILFS